MLVPSSSVSKDSIGAFELAGAANMRATAIATILEHNVAREKWQVRRDQAPASGGDDGDWLISARSLLTEALRVGP